MPKYRGLSRILEIVSKQPTPLGSAVISIKSLMNKSGMNSICPNVAKKKGIRKSKQKEL
jgi:hypothetical protein